MDTQGSPSAPTQKAAASAQVSSAFAGRTVFVTGHTGFKGGWLCHWLCLLGAKVVGFSQAPPSEPSLFEATGLSRHMTDLRGDIRDGRALSEALAQAAPDLVFHMAAQPLVRPSYDDPAGTFATNVMGTVNLFEAVRAADSVKALINVTSDKCYANQGWVWGYRECDPMGGHDPYSASKGCAELVADAYRASFFSRQGPTALASVRAGNVVGGGDWGAERLIPDCVRAFAKGEEVTLRAPNATRPWQHVLDPLRGYLRLAARLLAEPEAHVGGWNFGPSLEESWTVKDMVECLAGLWDGAGYRVAPATDKPEAAMLRLDSSKSLLRLGWKAHHGPRDILEHTAAWYRRYYEGADKKAMRAFTLQQIKELGGDI